ncbi:hypothetical protein DL96DRAFT_1710251 [Flagelloscypha sp. PMI_526]|nr:hypothetical protein DL96DRAFT_1710251 [Flagelloscypha sp. PMI_526]
MSICQGHRLVPSFHTEEEYEGESEEFLVCLDFGTTNVLNKIDEFQLMGMENSTPYLQLSHILFKGHIENTLGSDLLFKCVPVPQEERRASMEITETFLHRTVPFKPPTSKKLEFFGMPVQHVATFESVQKFPRGQAPKTSQVSEPSIADDVELCEDIGKITGIIKKPKRRPRMNKEVGNEKMEWNCEDVDDGKVEERILVSAASDHHPSMVRDMLELGTVLEEYEEELREELQI